jgi:hypothetical protein
MAGLTAFRQAYLSAGTENADEFSDFGARRMRYAIFWAFFENTAYSEAVNTWSKKFKVDYGLYKHIRTIYNPAYRLGSFWQAHLMGGALDPNAGDGKQKPSALPISIPDTNPRGDDLRRALAFLWKSSNWQIRKDIFTLRGAVLGDVALRIVDDPERGNVYLDVVQPSTLYDLTLDPFGNIKGYVIEEVRDDPRVSEVRGVDRDVMYREIVTRDGDLVHYLTTLNNAPFAWNNIAAEWDEPYGFVPLVVVKHNDVGLDWGWSELHAGLAKFREADDLASKANDQIRKLVDSPWLLSGVNAPSTTPTTTNSAALGGKPQPGREEVPILYAPAGATATPLVAPLDLGNTLLHIKELLAEIERDYPELKADELRLSGALTGRALELAQQPAADKVIQRRPNYDDALVRAHQMAIAIGGLRGYKGYEGFDLTSYEAGLLDHMIGERDVFRKTRGDRLEEDNLLYTGAASATTAGVPLETVLRRDGWTDDDLQDLYASLPQDQAMTQNAGNS